MGGYLVAAEPEAKPLDLADVLIAEYRHNHGEPDETYAADLAGGMGSLPAVQRLLHRRQQWALCISGGGIRSATFGLGVIEGLSKLGLLDRFDYLSTVSGGGYVGGWLTGWIHRHPRGIAGVMDDLNAFDSATSAYTTHSTHEPLIRPESDAVRHLRKYSNYLTPKLGALSADTWTGIATFVRNLVLLWTVLLPLLLGALLVPRVAAAIVTLPRSLNHHLQFDPMQWTPIGTLAFLLIGVGSLAIAIYFIGLSRPSLHTEGIGELDQRGFLRWCLLPTLVSAVVLSLAWSWWPNDSWWIIPGRSGASLHALLAFVAVGGILRIAVAVCSSIRRLQTPGASLSKMHWLGEILAADAAGALGGAVMWLVACVGFPDPAGLAAASEEPVGRIAAYVTFSTAAILGGFLASETLFVGLVSYFTDDDDREWWGRSGAWLLIAAVVWMAFSGLSLFGPAVLVQTTSWGMAALAAGGASAGITVAKLGASALTPATGGRPNPITAPLMFLLPPVFIVVLLAFLGLALDWALTRQPVSDSFFTELSQTESVGPIEIVVAAVVLTLIAGPMSYFVNINKFSIHAMYKYRLVRAYLGASNLHRKPNPFTGFDPKDNLYMGELWPNPRVDREPCRQPFHVLNTTLNLVSGSNYAWQERKAAPFSITPLHAGSWYVGYRPSEQYGNPDGGISLGTAVAISGAAASPNMGYHSSPAIGFLMTLFNVRLGWWLGNPVAPDPKIWTESGPNHLVAPLLQELFGLTNWKNPYVYLSDGGHFDNLGLYEMVMRRCRLIVVSDAGADPNFQFFDLGMAVRKIRIDLGVEIEMGPLPLCLARDKLRDPAAVVAKVSRYAAIGRIDYPEAPDEPGYLIYLKPGVYGDETADVQDYAAQHPAFPHDTTADQWFSESQFESYRRLGQFVIRAVFGDPPEQEPLQFQLERLREIMKTRCGNLKLKGTWLQLAATAESILTQSP